MGRNQLMSIEAQAAVVALAATQLSAETFRLTVKELVALGGQEAPEASAPVGGNALLSPALPSAQGDAMARPPTASLSPAGSAAAAQTSDAWRPLATGEAPRPSTSIRQTAGRSRQLRKPMELIKFEKTTLCVPKDLFRAASAVLGGDVSTRERAREFARIAPVGTTNRSSWVQEQLKRAIGDQASGAPKNAL